MTGACCRTPRGAFFFFKHTAPAPAPAAADSPHTVHNDALYAFLRARRLLVEVDAAGRRVVFAAAPVALDESLCKHMRAALGLRAVQGSERWSPAGGLRRAYDAAEAALLVRLEAPCDDGSPGGVGSAEWAALTAKQRSTMGAVLAAFCTRPDSAAENAGKAARRPRKAAAAAAAASRGASERIRIVNENTGESIEAIALRYTGPGVPKGLDFHPQFCDA
eukprot:m51a1_g1111 hypothetical protein (220) ;mRNA; f:145998-146775